MSFAIKSTMRSVCATHFSSMRDWLHIETKSEVNRIGRVLDKTPHEIALLVTHHEIVYGKIIEDAHYGYVLRCIKRAIFQAVRDTIAENSR